jgi:hypothetical protein
MKNWLQKVLFYWVIISGLLSPSWTGAGPRPNPVRVAVVSFQEESNLDRDYIRCRACGNILKSGPIDGNPVPTLTQILWDMLPGLGKDYDWISPGQVEGVYNTFLAKGFEKNTLVLMQSLGTQLKADFVLWGTVSEYQERRGTTYGVQKPAAVAMDLHLLDVRKGLLVWKNQWAETQKSLSENLFEMDAFLKRKARWVTAEELSRQGIEGMLKKFPPAEVLLKE